MVQRIQLRLGRCGDDVDIRAMTVDDTPTLFQPHGHFTLAVGAGSNRVDGIQLQRRLAVGDLLDGLKGSIDRAGTTGARLNLLRSEEHTSELQSRENLVCRL